MNELLELIQIMRKMVLESLVSEYLYIRNTNEWILVHG